MPQLPVKRFSHPARFGYNRRRRNQATPVVSRRSQSWRKDARHPPFKDNLRQADSRFNGPRPSTMAEPRTGPATTILPLGRPKLKPRPHSGGMIDGSDLLPMASFPPRTADSGRTA